MGTVSTGTATTACKPTNCPSRRTKRPSCSASVCRAWTSTPGSYGSTAAANCRMTALSSPPVPGRGASPPRREQTDPRDDAFAPELTLRTIEDAITLKQRVAARPSVIVVGGGPLGMEVASGCLQAGCEVTLVSDVQPLSRQLGDHLSGMFTSAAVRRGLRVVGGGKARLIDFDEGQAPQPGRGSPWPTARYWRPTSSSRPSATSQTSTGWPAPSSWSTGRCGWTPAAGSGRRSLPPATWRSSRRAAGYSACPCGPAPSTRPRSRPSACSRATRPPSSTSSRISGRRASVCRSNRSASLPWRARPTTASRAKTRSPCSCAGRTTDGSGTAAAVNYRIPIPKLRRLADVGPGALRPAAPVNA